jgi:hypothetical protein
VIRIVNVESNRTVSSFGGSDFLSFALFFNDALKIETG